MMGSHRYPAPHWQNTSRRLYRSTLWETRCSYINQPECFSSTHYLLISIAMVWIFKRKSNTQSIEFCTIMKQQQKATRSETNVSLPLIRSIWNNANLTSILKEVHSRSVSLKQKLLLLCGGVEANPGPYNEGTI